MIILFHDFFEDVPNRLSQIWVYCDAEGIGERNETRKNKVGKKLKLLRDTLSYYAVIKKQENALTIKLGGKDDGKG